MLRIDGRIEFLGVAIAGETGDWHIGKIGIRQIRGAVGKNSPHGFHDHVHALQIVPAFERDVLATCSSLR